jgi:hypothetical protein
MASTFGDTEADREEKEDAQRVHEIKISATSLTERLIQAAVDYETGRCSRRELSEARNAVEARILGVAQPPQDEMENYRLALAWIKGQSTDPQAKEIAATALDAYSVASPHGATPDAPGVSTPAQQLPE